MDPVGPVHIGFPNELVKGAVGYHPREPLLAFLYGVQVNVCRLATDVLGAGLASNPGIHIGAAVAAGDDDGLAGMLPQGFQHQWNRYSAILKEITAY